MPRIMLETILVLTLVHAAVGPQHLTITGALILDVFALVNVAAGPGEDATAILLVILIVTLEYVAVLLIFLGTPFSSPMLATLRKVAYVVLACGPGVLTATSRLTIVVLTRV